MKRRQQQRYNRLIREGFPYWEAKGFINTKLSAPALMGLRRERRQSLREAKKAGFPKRQLVQQIAIEYRSEGFYKQGKYQPSLLLERYEKRPSVIARARGLITKVRVRFELAADERSRYDRLLDAGFLPFEAQTLAKMEHIHPENREETWNSITWQAMIESRRSLVRYLKGRKYSNAQIRRMIEKYYMLPERDIWDWLKREYKPRVSPKRYQVERQAEYVAKTDVVMSPRHAKRREVVMIWD